uniref:taste receptor type 2 member 140-like n=1 Tax=Jaculus jaculus TaxID=51337 RepID=UPI001E1B2EDD|nr:taste receptor type 2 member 140-like [Jaculus jaculus]
MDGVLVITLTIIFIAQFIIGILGNGFIIMVNCLDWVKRRKITSMDQILTALAISRLILLLTLVIDWRVSIIYPLLLRTITMLRIFHISWAVTNHFSIWLATGLCIFYFLKIAIFSNPLFYYLKWRVTKLIAMTLLMSLVLLGINIVMLITCIDVWIYKSNWDTSYNSSSRLFAEYSRLILFPNLMFTLIPFVISLAIFLLLIFSLWKHLRNMQHNAPGWRNASTLAHIRALQVIIAFLLLYITFFLSVVVEVWTVVMENMRVILVAQVMVTIFPAVHSCVLILANDKMRQAWLLLQWWLRCRF